MLKKLNTILNMIIGSFIGAFAGYSIYKYWDYKAHPDVYEITSFPWYTGIQLFGALAAAVVIIAVIVKLVIKGKMK